MTDRPMIFSAPMIRALLAGRKSQTRRIVHGETIQLLDITGEEQEHLELTDRLWPVNEAFVCLVLKRSMPFGTGDRLWVRESFSGLHCYDVMDWSPGCWSSNDPLWFWADGNPKDGDWTRPKPSIHMPRWASRLTLTVTAVKVERLQDISEEDALAEGVDDFAESLDKPGSWEGLSRSDRTAMVQVLYGSARRGYQHLWEMLHGPEAWATNPWVTASSFDVERRNIDATADAETAA